MRITIFQSDKGDCLLLSSGSGAKTKHVLIDGGMRASYNSHVAKHIAKLPRLDAVCVTHIDQDHIAGVLQMLDDQFAWRVHRYQRKHGNDRHERPDNDEPPKIVELWHNGLEEQLGKDAREIAEVLAEKGNILSVLDPEDFPPQDSVLPEDYTDLATSIPEAIRLGHRIGVSQLGIRLNRGKRLMIAQRKKKNQKSSTPLAVGSMQFTVIAPFVSDLKDLKTKWREWLQENKEKVAALTKRSRLDAKNLTASAVSDVIDLMQAQAAKFGVREDITIFNLASLMMLVEENGRTLLLTGDGFCQTVLDGLEAVGKLKKAAGMHVNVLKVQHHGAIANIDEDFCRRITADHYIFCGNGAHDNPEIRVLELIYNSRLGTAAQKSSNPGAAGRFTFWINSHPSVTPDRYRKKLEAIEKAARRLSSQSHGKLQVHFLREDHFPAMQI